MKRLRENPTDAELAEWYARPHDADLWGHGHRIRVDATVALGAGAVEPTPRFVVDLSCGNGEIAERLADHFDCGKILGDLAPGYELTGDLLDTIPKVAERLETNRKVLFVLSETIEHVPDPGMVLEKIPLVADQLILSTPIDDEGGTPEHIWSFSIGDVLELLEQTDWIPVERADLWLPGTLSYQIHRCVRL